MSELDIAVIDRRIKFLEEEALFRRWLVGRRIGRCLDFRKSGRGLDEH
jgi:hypothetical protein